MRSNNQGNASNSGGGFPPRSGYDELDTTLMPPRPGEAYNRGSPGPTGSMSGSQGGPPAQPFPVTAPGGQGGEEYFCTHIYSAAFVVALENSSRLTVNPSCFEVRE